MGKKCCANCLFCYRQDCTNEGIFVTSIRNSVSLKEPQRKAILKKSFKEIFEAEPDFWVQLDCIEDQWEQPIKFEHTRNEIIKRELADKTNCSKYYLYKLKGNKTNDACRTDRDVSKENKKHKQTLIVSIIAALIAGALTMYAAIYSVNKGNNAIQTNKQFVKQVQNK